LPDDPGSCIADCLLPSPRRFPREQFHFTTTRLHRDYGEQPPSEHSPDLGPPTIPYIKTFDLAGGLCSQACCFVATTVLNRHASAIHGLGEITAFASNAKGDDLLIHGLDEGEMITYLAGNNLNAIYQISNPHWTSHIVKPQVDQCYDQALQGYISSGMPVILQVDVRRLLGVGIQGKSIYALNNCVPEIDTSNGWKHAICAIGCNRKNGTTGSSFGSPHSTILLQDSLTQPFLEASTGKLAWVGICQDAGIPPDMRYPGMLPVTPRRVRMPLLWWKDHLSQASGNGLLHISRQHNEPHIPLINRRFELIQIANAFKTQFRIAFHKDHWEDVADLLHTVLPSKLRECRGWDSTRWVWVEYGNSVIKIWDAETMPNHQPDPCYPAHYLGAIILLTAEGPQCKPCPSIPKKPTHDAKVSPSQASMMENENIQEYHYQTLMDRLGKQRKTTNAPANLKGAVITSFAVNGLEEARSVWPSGAKYAEYYACMRNDLAPLLDLSPSELDRVSVVNRLAELYDDESKLQRFSERLAVSFQIPSLNRNVVGFATFVPEIMSRNEEVFQSAQKALMTLIRSARLINCKHWPFTLEIVCGSRAQGVSRTTNEEGEYFLVSVCPEKMATDILLKRLVPVAQLASEHPIVQLALEFEPGPLFTLGSKETLSSLCRLVRQHKTEAIRQVVGVNLDIPHWTFLGQIDWKWMNEQADDHLLHSIIHAHVSDHSKGHFCDNIIATFTEQNGHALQSFRKWIAFLKRLMKIQRPSVCPSFSGFISCEMEACSDSDYVETSFKRLESLL
jgi:hypothetical protein